MLRLTALAATAGLALTALAASSPAEAAPRVACSNADWATPTARAAILIRPVSRPDITCLNPRPSTPPTRFAAGQGKVSKSSSAVSTPL